MKIKTKIEFKKGYLPTKRHKILQYYNVEKQVLYDLKETTYDKFPVVATTVSYGTVFGDNNTSKFEVINEDYHYFNGNFYIRELYCYHRCYTKGYFPFEELIDEIKNFYRRAMRCDDDKNTEEYRLNELKEVFDRYLIVDGDVFVQTGEPRYVINTFGLGYNHGGSSLSVVDYYNDNISYKMYFNALNRQNAISEFNKIALNRGDTESVDYEQECCNIIVHDSSVFKVNPKKDYQKGGKL